MITSADYQARAILWSFLTMVKKKRKDREEKPRLVDTAFIPILLEMNCLVPSQKWYEDTCRVQYHELQKLGVYINEKELKRCISRVKYTFFSDACNTPSI